MINVSDIQHFSVGDGPGIRTTVFLKGCNLRCPWCHNPETQSAKSVELHYKANGQTVVSGSLMTAEAIVADVMADGVFYADNGGGLTVSGGECLLHPSDTAEILRLTKSESARLGYKMTTIVDTAASVPFSAFEAVDEYTDMYFIDLKTADEAKYREIGGNLAVVSENIGKLIKMGRQVRIRVPLIPDFNTSEDDVEAIASLASRLGATGADMIPFHRLAVGKYGALGLDYKYKNTPPLSLDEAKRCGEHFTKYGIKVRIER